MTNLDYIRAHQYLYYCLGRPVLSDSEYDQWGKNNCKEDYKNGSDLESSYSKEQKELATLILAGKEKPLP